MGAQERAGSSRHLGLQAPSHVVHGGLGGLLLGKLLYARIPLGIRDTETCSQRVRTARHVQGRSSRQGLGPACGCASSRASTRLRPRRVYGRSALATTHTARSPSLMYPHHACWNPRAKCTAGPVQPVLACWKMSWPLASRPHALPTRCHPHDRARCSPFWLLGASEKHWCALCTRFSQLYSGEFGGKTSGTGHGLPGT